VVTLSYFWLVQEREESDFFLEIDFYVNETLHQHWSMSRQLSYSNDYEEKFFKHYGLSARKRHPREVVLHF